VGVIIGFIWGMALSVHYVWSNAYLHYGMYRLIGFSFQENLNRLVAFMVAAVLIIWIIWTLFVKGFKRGGNIALTFAIIVFMILLVDWVLRGHTHHSLATALKQSVFRVRELLSGEIALSYFLFIVRIRLKILVIGVAGVIAIPLLFLLLGRIKLVKWTEWVSRRVKPAPLRKCALFMILLVLILNAGLWIYNRYNPPQGPNVIIFLVDALRKDHMGLYGYSRDTTPNIDRFAATASVVLNATSPSSWTCPSIASLFSLLYPSVHGLNSYSESKASALDRKIVTLAEILKEKGYATGAFVANHWVCSRLQYDQGFDTFDPINLDYKSRASEVNKKALDWISHNKERPFFAYVHYMDVHGPYSAPEPYGSFFQSTGTRPMTKMEARRLAYLSVGREKDNNDLNYYIDQYDGEIRYVDNQIGQFLKKLRQDELMDDSIIIVTSDHGEAFFEHGKCDHGWSLYGEEINIPFIVKAPSGIRLPETGTERVEQINLIATILDRLGCVPPYALDGNSLESISPPGVPVFSQEISPRQRGNPKVAIIDEGLKAIYIIREGRVKEIYDLKEDDLELDNLAGRVPLKAEVLGEKIEVWLREKADKRRELGLRELTVRIKDESTLKQLRALGYLQ